MKTSEDFYAQNRELFASFVELPTTETIAFDFKATVPFAKARVSVTGEFEFEPAESREVKGHAEFTKTGAHVGKSYADDLIATPRETRHVLKQIERTLTINTAGVPGEYWKVGPFPKGCVPEGVDMEGVYIVTGAEWGGRGESQTLQSVA